MKMNFLLSRKPYLMLMLAVTANVRAECPAIDLFGCRAKAEAEQRQWDERNYQKAIDDIYQQRLSLSSNSEESSCQSMANQVNSARGHFVEGPERCIMEVRARLQEFRSEVSSGRRKPASCEEWAVAKGTEWEQAKWGMQVSLLGAISKPVFFVGKVDNGNSSELVVRSDSDNAIIGLSTSTFVVGDLAIGGRVRGYGTQTGKRQVVLVDGSATTIPVIGTQCIEVIQ